MQTGAIAYRLHHLPVSAGDSLINAAEAEARARGVAAVTTVDMLLALARAAERGEGDKLIAGVLAGCGLSTAAIVEAEPVFSEDYPPPRELVVTAELTEVVSRGERLATILGTEVTERHVFVAALGDPNTLAAGITEGAGLTFGSAYTTLIGSEPPAWLRRESKSYVPGERVYVDTVRDFRLVLDELPGVLPPGTKWGFNSDDEGRFFFDASSEIDLPAVIRHILARADLR